MGVQTAAGDVNTLLTITPGPDFDAPDARKRPVGARLVFCMPEGLMKRDFNWWRVPLQIPLLISVTLGALVLISIAANFLLVPAVVLVWMFAKLFNASSSDEIFPSPETS
jgi:hypothetical protein